MKNMKSVNPKKPVSRECWFKLSVHFKDADHCNTCSLSLAQSLRNDYPAVYFARYCNATHARTDFYVFCLELLEAEIVPTAIRLRNRMRSYCQKIRFIAIKITGTASAVPLPRVDKPKRCPGSFAHAAAFDCVLKMSDQLNPLPPEQKHQQFVDVLHWLNNMFGYDYVDEARNNLHSIHCILGVFESSINAGKKGNISELQKN